MNFPSLVRRLPLMAIVFGAQIMAAQMPLSEGAEHHPSAYRYPLHTWTREVPGSSRGKIKDDAVSYTALMRKLQNIVLPRIEFRDTTLADAVEFLRQESRRLDADPNPENRGVNIFLRMPSSASLTGTDVAPVPGPLPGIARPTPAEAKGRITLTMTQMPLLEALKYVASQAGMKVAVEPYAVSVVPQNYVIQNLVAAGYEVPPELLGLEADSENFCPRVNLETYFEAKGVDFPVGASAVYLTGTRMLIVRDTQENLDKIVSVISSALKPTDPQPENP